MLSPAQADRRRAATTASLTDAETAELAGLRALRTKALTGTLPTQVRTADGRFVSYQPPDMARVEQRIAALEAKAATATSCRPARGPLYIRF